MKAVLYEAFNERPKIARVADPDPAADGVVIRVMATGVCRSDWHGWKGHDPDIVLPHVPGHEFAGVIETVGRDVRRWKAGDRVTVPFVAACGNCPQCNAGHQQVCDHQFQPGFTRWGSFAEFVAIERADLNLVRLPEDLDFTTAASLGCRFVTSFRAVVDQGRAKAGEWVAVHGCGGVGLSAIQIASALGANVVAIDISQEKLALARAVGAFACVNASEQENVVDAIRQLTDGGVHVSLDALGHAVTCCNSIRNLRKRGRHVQVGLMLAEHAAPAVPMAEVIGRELEIYGSHGMQAHRYDAIFALLKAGRIAPQKLVGRTITLEQSIDALVHMDRNDGTGVTVITGF